MRNPAIYIVMASLVVSLAAGAGGGPSIADAAGPQMGDILAADGRLLFSVDHVTGARTILTDFANAAQGPTGSSFTVATGLDGSIYVTDGASDQKGKLFKVFFDGTRSVLSDATDSTQGDPWHTTDTVAVDADGSILVSDRGFGGGGNAAGLWRVVASSGFRTKLVDYGGHPEGLVLDAGNNILLGDAEGGTDCHTFGGCGSLSLVNPVAGTLTPLGDFGNPSQGPLGEDAGQALARDTDGTILVVDPFAPPGSPSCFDVNGCGSVFRWDPITKMHSLLTKYGDAAQGSVSSFRPKGVAVGTNGTIFVSPCPGTGGAGAICTVDRVTGVRTIFSDFGNATQGSLGAGPHSLAIITAVVTATTTTTMPLAGATTTTLPHTAEICGNCIDDDGNGRTDFEDAQCCPQAHMLAYALRKTQLVPRKGGTSLMLDSTLSGVQAKDLNPLRADVFVEIRDRTGEVLCAHIPAAKFVAKRKGKYFAFLDRRGQVAGTSGISGVVVKPVHGNVLVHVEGKTVRTSGPHDTALQVTVAFRDPSTAEAGNRCGATAATFRKKGTKGGLKFP